jgi:hypothetical protein
MVIPYFRSKSKSADFLFNFNEYLNNFDKKKNLDFIKLYNYLMTCFTTNSLRKQNYKFKKGRKFDFDYRVMIENDSMESILSIQRKFPYFRSGLRNENMEIFINEYISFMNESLEKLCTNIYLPVKGISFEIMCIIKKNYNKLVEEKKYKRSTKINYKVLEELGIITFSEENKI